MPQSSSHFLAQESGFTLFAIPFLMELLDFLTAQVADEFQQFACRLQVPTTQERV